MQVDVQCDATGATATFSLAGAGQPPDFKMAEVAQGAAGWRLQKLLGGERVWVWVRMICKAEAEAEAERLPKHLHL